MKNKLNLLLTLFLAIVCAPTSNAADDEGLKVDPQSFKNINSGDRAAGEDMGGVNMSSMNLDWSKYTDSDGEDTGAALIVTFDNMPMSEVKNVKPQISGGTIVNHCEPREINGRQCLLVIIPSTPSGVTRDITFVHPIYGSTRLLNKTFVTHNMYVVNVMNAKRVNITISSIPDGARVFLDRKDVGNTPVTVNDVSMGRHELELTAPNSATSNAMPRTQIDVTEAKTVFGPYDLRKTVTTEFISEPKDAYLKITNPIDGTIIAQGAGRLKVNNLPYGGYEIEGTRNGQWICKESVTINGHTPAQVVIKVIESKTISFTAVQNNYEVRGAQINLDGSNIGQTPLDYPVTYGTHRVDMSYYGKNKTKTLKVSQDSRNDFQIVLPKASSYHTRFNPFDVDYNKKVFGFDFGYVNKSFTIAAKYGGKTEKAHYNNWGEEDKDMHGMQMGFVWQPYFGYGQGLITGMYWQYYWGSVGYFEEDPTYHEHNLYIPLLYQFRLPLRHNFSIFICGGIAASIGLEHKLTYDDDYGDEQSINAGFGHNDEYDWYLPNRVQWLAPVGGGIQINCMQFSFKYSFGLNDNKDMHVEEDGYKITCKARMMEASFAIVF